jgi:hypothetical protein
MARHDSPVGAGAERVGVRKFSREIPMRGNIAGLLAVALMSVCGVASANIIYNVDITDGTETVSGTITTDGVIGALDVSDVIAWDLIAVGPVSFHTQSLDPTQDSFDQCGANVPGVGCGITATSDQLVFTSVATPGFPYRLGLGYNITPGTTADGLNEIIFQPNGVEVSEFRFTPSQINYVIRLPVPYLIGTAQVPEPGTFTLLGLALAGLGFARKRSRGRQSTAV